MYLSSYVQLLNDCIPPHLTKLNMSDSSIELQLFPAAPYLLSLQN